MSFLLFFAVALAITGLIHLFLYRGLVRGLGLTSPAVLWPLRALAALLALSYILTRLIEGVAPEGVVRAAHWISSVWLGLMFHLLWVGAVFWIVKTVLRIAGVWGRLEPQHALLGRTAVGAVAAVAITLSVVGMVVAQSPARVRRVDVPVKGITPELRRLRIAVVADLHTGVLVGESQIDRWLGELAALSPDLILVPGDIVDYPPDRIPELARALSRLKAPLGVFATTGNHEYYAGLEKSLSFLETSGMRVLMNERVELPVGLIVAGVEDRTGRSFGRRSPPVEVVLGPGAKTRPTILMNHTPGTEAARSAVAGGADLMVSGHTHGGQIWPFSILTRLSFPLHHGLYDLGAGSQLTTSGIGYWGPPMRLGKPPEILLVRLVGRDEPGVIDVDR